MGSSCSCDEDVPPNPENRGNRNLQGQFNRARTEEEIRNLLDQIEAYYRDRILPNQDP